MSPAFAGLTIIVALFVLLGTGMPIAFALGLAAVCALFLESGPDIIYVLSETMFSGTMSGGMSFSLPSSASFSM